MNNPYTYYGTIRKQNYDGDTVDVVLDLGFDTLRRIRLRLLGLDTSEMRSKDAEKKAKAVKARDRVRELLPVGSDVIVHCRKPADDDKYGRYLAEIIAVNGDVRVNVNEALLSEGLAVPYDGGLRA